MKRLLDAVGESHWSRWIGTCITAWHAKRDASHHLSAYRGIGSFNDIWICRANHHTLTEAQEPWANVLFTWLQSLCYFLAQHPNVSFDANTLSSAIGKHDSVLAAFVEGDKAPASIRGLAKASLELHGWRCLGCGHGETSSRDIETLIAQDVIPDRVFRSCELSTLDQLVDQVLACDMPELVILRRSLAVAAMECGVVLVDRDGWMSPCPNCGSGDTAVYRWRLMLNDGLRFEPADDNLPMRG